MKCNADRLCSGMLMMEGHVVGYQSYGDAYFLDCLKC
jgi:hypothetical protein